MATEHLPGSTSAPDAPTPEPPDHDTNSHVPWVPSFAVAVVLPVIVAAAANFALLLSGNTPILSAVVGSVFMGGVMTWWMNNRYKRRVAEAAKIAEVVEKYGTAPPAVGGWANPNRRQRIERWFDRNRVYRRR